jgi:hypothetical protein
VAIEIVPFTPERIADVRDFNARLRAADIPYSFPESNVPTWLPPIDAGPLYQEFFLAADDRTVRGAYILKHQDFLVGGSVMSVGAFQLPLSEGIIDRAYAGVGVQLLRDAMRRQPLLYTLGIGSEHEAAARLLRAARFGLAPVPFLFKVLHARRFLREIRPLRGTRLRRFALDLAALSGAGAVGIGALQGLSSPHLPRRPVRPRELGAFDARVDDVWAAAAPTLGWAAVRDQAVLARLYDAPGNRFIRVGIDDGERLFGWAVLVATDWTDHKYFGGMRTGAIVDLLARPGSERALVAAAVDRLHAEGVDIIVTNQSLTRVCDALRHDGFLSGPSNYLLAASPALMRLTPSLDTELGAMHFTRGDGDGPINL